MSNKNAKSWKSYFLDFIMLFLAVSLGFMADNFREKSSERTKEKEYIRSMIEDVEEDRVEIKDRIKANGERVLYLDSLVNKSYDFSATNEDRLALNRYFSQVVRHPEFLTPTELTMQQLKNAGGMRLIKSTASINEIIRYDTKLKKIANQQVYYENYQNKAIDIGTKIFNIQNLIWILRNPGKTGTQEKYKLLTEDEMKLKELGNSIAMYKGIIEYYVILLKGLDQQGEVLIQTLNDEYKL